MFDTKIVGKKIAELRKAKNMTQMELADSMGVSYQAVSNWERGNSMPDISKLPDLVEILDCTIDQLLSSREEAELLNNIIAGNTEEYMEALISAALHQKVSSNGQVSKYSYDNKHDYLDILLKNKIQEAAKDALKEYIAENAELLKVALKNELEKTATKNELVKTFVDGATKAFACEWGFRCDVNFKSPE